MLNKRNSSIYDEIRVSKCGLRVYTFGKHETKLFLRTKLGNSSICVLDIQNYFPITYEGSVYAHILVYEEYSSAFNVNAHYSPG